MQVASGFVERLKAKDFRTLGNITKWYKRQRMIA